MATVAKIDQHSDEWRGVGQDANANDAESAAESHRAEVLQPLALAVMWPVTPELVDNMDKEGKAEMDALRALIKECVACLSKQVSTGGELSQAVAFEDDGDDADADADADAELKLKIQKLVSRLDSLQGKFTKQWESKVREAGGDQEKIDALFGRALAKVVEAAKSSIGGRRNLKNLRKVEPEGAEYLDRLRKLIDAVAKIRDFSPETASKPEHVELLNALQLTRTLPLREDLVDNVRVSSSFVCFWCVSNVIE